MKNVKISINIENELFSAIKERSNKESQEINEYILSSLEKQYLSPFLSKRHLRNYYYLNTNLTLAKEINKKRQVLFYILAYDGIYMEYVREIYKEVDNKEVVIIPKELNDILHPGFCLIDAGCDFFEKGAISNMENGFKWFKYDDNEVVIVLNAIMLMKNILSIKDGQYSSGLFKRDLNCDLNRNYSIDEFMESRLFDCYSNKMKLLIKELFLRIKEQQMEVYLKPCAQDELTFSLCTATGNRLAIVSSSDDGSNLRVGINRWKNTMHGNMLYCYDIEDIIPVVKDVNIPDSDLLTKYNEIV